MNDAIMRRSFLPISKESKMPAPILLSAAEAGERLGVSADRVRQLVKDGRLQVHRRNPMMFQLAAIIDLYRSGRWPKPVGKPPTKKKKRVNKAD